MTTPAPQTQPAPPAPPAPPVPAPAPPAPPAPPIVDPEDDDGRDGPRPKVPYDRFQEMAKEKNLYKGEAKRLAEENKNHQARIAELEASLEGVKTQARTATAKAETGIDDADDLQTFLRAYDKAHEKVDEKKRPSIGDWKKALAADEKAAAESGLPTSWRRAYLTPPAAGSGAAKVTIPNRNLGVAPSGPKSWSQMSKEEQAAELTKAKRVALGR